MRRVGALVIDEEGCAWVYVGRTRTARSRPLVFVRLTDARWGPDALQTYSATYRQTLERKFPGVTFAEAPDDPAA